MASLSANVRPTTYMSPARRWAWLVSLVMGVAVPCAHAAVPRPPDQDPAKIVTPHVRWGKPLAGGTIRACAVMPFGTTRDIYELAQRLDLEFDLVPTERVWRFGSTGYPGVPTPDEAARLLRQYLDRKPDVFIIGNFYMSYMPIELRYRMIEQIVGGAGLVVTNVPKGAFSGLGPAEAHILKDKVGPVASVLGGVPYERFMRLEATDYRKFKVATQGDVATTYKRVPLPIGTESTCYRIGKGRFVGLACPGYVRPYSSGAGLVPSVPTPPDEPVLAEYLYALVAKAVRWAAGRTPELTVQSIVLAGPAKRKPGAPLTARVACRTGEDGFSGELHWTVRDRWREELARGAVGLKVTGPKGTVDLSVPDTGAGPRYLDVWVRDLDENAPVVDWATGAWDLTGPTRITRVALANACVEPGQPIRGSVSVQAPPTDARLRLRIRDTDYRIVEQRTIPINAPVVPFRMRLRRATAIVHWLEADVTVGGTSVAYAIERFTVPQRRRDDYYVSADDERLMHWPSRLRCQVARSYGVDCHRTYGVGKSGVVGSAHFGITPGPFFTHIGGCYHLGWNLCLSDPAYHEQLVSGLTYLAKRLKPYGPSCYNLGDDSGPSSSLCKRPGCFDAFISYLKKTYSSLEAMSKVWGVRVTDWKQVTKDLLGKQQTAGNPAPWMDYLYYHEQLYIDILRKSAETVRAVDPHAWVGQDASGFGTVMDRVLEHCNYVTPYYDRVLMKKLTCWKTMPGFYGGCVGVYTPGGRDAFTMSIPWDLALAGNNGVLFWTLASGLAGDLTLHPRGYMLESIRELKGGIGQLLMRAQRQYDPIVLYHSRSAAHASNIEYKLATVKLSQSTFQTIVEDLGMQARWTSTHRTEQGELARRKPKLLVLPYCQALSTAEAQAIRQYVADGGTVLTDVRPGVYNDHCRGLSPGSLDDVFGITRRPDKDYVEHGDLVLAEPFGALKPNQPVTQTIADRSVRLAGAKAVGRVGKAPALVVNRFGKGRAVMLNFFVGRYESLLGTGKDAPLRALYRELLRQAGCEPTLGATIAGRHAPACERVRFQLGQAELVGVAKRAFPGETYPMKLALALPRKAHVYDVRAGAYLGHADKVEVLCTMLERKVLALLPYKVRRIDLGVFPRVRRGRTLPLALSVTPRDRPVSHLARVEAVDPSGAIVPWFQDKVWLKDGKGTALWPIAHNERPGTWTVTATDVLTGTSMTRKVTVREARSAMRGNAR